MLSLYILTALSIILAVMLVISGFLMHLLSIDLMYRCNHATTGTIIGYETIPSQVEHKDLFLPTYEYYVAGKRYTERGNIRTDEMNHSVGNQEDLFYNPEDPTDYYIVDDLAFRRKVRKTFYGNTA